VGQGPELGAVNISVTGDRGGDPRQFMGTDIPVTGDRGGDPRQFMGSDTPQQFVPSDVSQPRGSEFPTDIPVTGDRGGDPRQFMGSDALLTSMPSEVMDLPPAAYDDATQQGPELGADPALRPKDMQQPNAFGGPADTGDAGPRTEAQDMMSGMGQVGDGIPRPSPDDETEAGAVDATDAGTSAAKSIAETFDKENMSKKQATETIDDYKKEFLDQMPEYRGMSEEEKGYALMEAGLRVAAGESANAITNVAKGLQGLGATFAKDEKEKRAWDRQVELSAAKYGLSRISENLKRSEADKRKGFFFYDQNKKTKENPEGQLVRITQEQLLANNGKIPAGYKTETLVIEDIKASNSYKAKLAKLGTDLAKENKITYKEANGIKDSLTSAHRTLVQAENGAYLLNGVIKKLAENPGDIVGAGAELKNLWGKTLSFIGKDRKGFRTRAEVEKAINMAFQRLIPVTLGGVQSANSISNRDVQFLADAFINAGFLKRDDEGGFSVSSQLAVTDEKVFLEQLQKTVGLFREAQANALSTFEFNYNILRKASPEGRYGIATFEPLIAQIKPNVEKFRSTRTKEGLSPTAFGRSPIKVLDYFDSSGKLIKPLPRQ
jgi:hypothetical protein